MAASLSEKSRPTDLAFAPERLSSINLSACLVVADRCFPPLTDQEFLRSHWQRVLSGQNQYFCEEDGAHLTLLDHFAYRSNGQIIGFGGLYQHDDKPHQIWLNWFGVDPNARGRGLGSNLIEHLAEVASNYSASSLVGYTGDTAKNVDTQRFYERAGFTRTTTYEFKGELVRLYERALGKSS